MVRIKKGDKVSQTNAVGHKSGAKSQDGVTDAVAPIAVPGRTTKPAPAPAATKTQRKAFIIDPTPEWYNAVPELKASAAASSISESQLSEKLSKANSLLAQDVERFTSTSSHTSSTSDAQFLTRVLSSGTLSDKLSALTLMAQASPVHNARALESLKTMASKKGREESLKALRAIVDWWIGGGAPSRKLKVWRDQPLGHADVNEKYLVLWAFEDWLKKFFFSILQLLEPLSLDSLPFVRSQALSLIAQLLREKPEQEQNLLRLLVNKLGDSNRTVAAKASFQILQTLQAHPKMKSIVIREISALATKHSSSATSSHHGSSNSGISKPGTSTGDATNNHARYYAVITFNQIVLGPEDKLVARRLIEIYFDLFREVLNRKAETGSEKEGKVSPEEHKRADSGKGRQEKRKIRERNGVEDKGKGQNTGEDGAGFAEVEDADSKSISALLTGVNRALPFARLQDGGGKGDGIFDKHVDTLFRITHSSTFNISIQAFVLILQVSAFKKSIIPRFYRTLYASLLDPRLLESSKQAMYLNLLFRAMKVDNELPRLMAFVKRFLQSLVTHQPSFICGGLFLLGELFNTTPGLKQMVTSPAPPGAEYDPRKREPEYANAQHTCLWELLPLTQHFHPAVSLHARQLLTGAQLTANADLSLNTLSHFLDRFVYRNPKKPKPRGASAMQPGAYTNDGTRLVKSAGGELAGTVNDEMFWKKAKEDVAVDQLFYHKFFTTRQDQQQAKMQKVGKRKGVEDSEEEVENGDDDASTKHNSSEGSDDEVGDDPEEAEIWKVMKASAPQLEDDGLMEESDGTPEGMSDLSDSDGDDDANSSVGSEVDEANMSAEFDDELQGDSGSDQDFIEDEDDIMSVGSQPMGLVDWDSEVDGEQEEEWGGISGQGDQTRKRKGKGGEDGKKKKKARKDLPTFASMEDYAAMIDAEPEDNI